MQSISPTHSIRHLTLSLLLLIVNGAYATEYVVSSADELGDLSLQAGDIVIWEDGTYSEDDNISLTANGTASNPILIKAENPGGVTFTGGMTIDVGGDYVIIEGFRWKGGSGKSNHIEFRKGEQYANYSTLRNCVIDDLTPVSYTHLTLPTIA